MMLSLLDILTRGEVAGAMGFHLGLARVEKVFGVFFVFLAGCLPFVGCDVLMLCFYWYRLYF